MEEWLHLRTEAGEGPGQQSLNSVCETAPKRRESQQHHGARAQLTCSGVGVIGALLDVPLPAGRVTGWRMDSIC